MPQPMTWLRKWIRLAVNGLFRAESMLSKTSRPTTSMTVPIMSILRSGDSLPQKVPSRSGGGGVSVFLDVRLEGWLLPFFLDAAAVFFDLPLADFLPRLISCIAYKVG
jgi:hypothetical protein